MASQFAIKSKFNTKCQLCCSFIATNHSGQPVYFHVGTDFAENKKAQLSLTNPGGNGCSDKVSRPRVGLGRFMIFGQAGESERFRCVGITLAEIYENTTTRRLTSGVVGQKSKRTGCCMFRHTLQISDRGDYWC